MGARIPPKQRMCVMAESQAAFEKARQDFVTGKYN